MKPIRLNPKSCLINPKLRSGEELKSFLINSFWYSIIFILFMFLCNPAQAQEDGKEKIKTGWTFGAIPAIAYDSDVGFKYGGLVNLYNFGDGSTYPKYLHSIYLEWSRTTKGSGINQFTYDSDQLIPGVRLFVEASHLTEQALDFYGFNGYESYYNPNFEDDTHEDYISRMYYRQDRKLTRIKADFVGKIKNSNFRWFAGIAYHNIKLDTVDINRLNKGKDDEDKLPAVGGGLFGKYIDWGLLPEDQVGGGNNQYIKLGMIYDTRDNEPNPMKGLWTEFQLVMAPSFLGNKDYSFSKLVFTHRQYFTLYPKILNLAYRVSYQGKISGTMPFYALPFVYNSPPALTRDGLGGSKTIRGVLRNRVVGEGFTYGNIELRWKFLRTVIFNQNFYIALSSFLDGGYITQKYELQETNDPRAVEYLLRGDENNMHLGYGLGLHFALNENFIVALDYGLANDKRDGNNGVYIGMNFIF